MKRNLIKGLCVISMSIVLTVPFVGCSLADFFGSSDTTKPTNTTVATSTVSATTTPVSTKSATNTEATITATISTTTTPTSTTTPVASATITDNTPTATSTVSATSTETVNVSSVSLSKSTDTIVLGDTDNLTATVTPDNATNQGVTWTSSDNNVAKVDNTGKVTSVNAGTATITAILAADSSKTATCNVTVNFASIKGIDVSHWQESIDWQSAKSDGVQFAMIASSYGDGTSSYKNNGVDSMFETNYATAKANGINVGAYHYSYAKTVAAATTEATFFISELKGKQFDYPVCVDIEDASQSTLDNATLTNISLTYLNMLKQAGYYPMIYANKSWFTTKLDSNALTYDHWLAQWNSTITYSGPVQMWQYSSTGVVKGISGDVDMDTSFVDYATLIKSLHVNGY